MFTYKTQGVCSRWMHIGLDEDDRITDIRIEGGCNGNTKGLCVLAKGREAREVIQSLRGIQCEGKATSCPDQLSRALELALQEKDAEDIQSE